MRRTHAPTPIEIIGIAGGLMIMSAFAIGELESATPTMKVPGPYPYETPVQIPAPRPFPNHRSYPRLLLFPILNRHPHNWLLRIAIHEREIPGAR